MKKALLASLLVVSPPLVVPSARAQSPGEPGPVAAERARFRKAAACLGDGIAIKASEGGELRYRGLRRGGGAVELFVAERIAAERRAWDSATPEEFCARQLLEPWLAAALAAREEEKKQQAKARPAKPGKGPAAQAVAIDAGALGSFDAELPIAAARAKAAKTTTWLVGYGDLAAQAVKAQWPKVKWSPSADRLLRAAAVAPEEHRFYSDEVHARTPDFDLEAGAERAVDKGRSAFVLHVSMALEQFGAEASAGHDDRAILWLAAALHAAQDLVTARGMTLREHAGLAFFRGESIDLPPSDAPAAQAAAARKKRTEQQLKLARRVVALAGKKADDKTIARLAAWQVPPPGDNDQAWSLDRAAESAFGKPLLAEGGLANFYAHAALYRQQTRPPAELQAAIAGRWDVEAVMAEIERTVAPPPVGADPGPQPAPLKKGEKAPQKGADSAAAPAGKADGKTAAPAGKGDPPGKDKAPAK